MKQEGNALGGLGSAAKTVLLILYALFALFPLLWMLILSFKPDSEMFTTTFIFTPTLENFRAVFAESDFLRTLWNNLVVSVLAVGLSLVAGVPAAYALGRFDFKGKEDIAFTFLSFKFVRTADKLSLYVSAEYPSGLHAKSDILEGVRSWILESIVKF